MEIWQLIILIITPIAGLAVGVGSLFVYAKKGGTEAMSVSNDLLRKTVEDQGKELLRQRDMGHERDNAITSLKIDVARIKADKDGLSAIIQTALIEYFKHEPKIVKAAQNMISANGNGKEQRA